MVRIPKIDFGIRIKELREKKGLTQAQACKLLGVSKSSLSTYERNVREPDFETLIRMSNLYNTTIDYLLYRDNIPAIVLSNFTESQRETIITIFKALERELKKDD